MDPVSNNSKISCRRTTITKKKRYLENASERKTEKPGKITIPPTVILLLWRGKRFAEVHNNTNTSGSVAYIIETEIATG